MTSEFDLKAREWDKNQIHVERSKAIAGVIKRTLLLKKGMKALEFGAGTGLLSFFLKEYFSEITLMDTSIEMINVMRGKISAQEISNMKPVFVSLEHEDYADEFDIIYNQMVFHHVENLDIILQKFYNILVPAGYLAIADLYAEDGTFHGDGFKGHKGFDVDWLSGKVRDAGFRHVRHQPCFIINKTIATGKTREYPVFLLTASR